MVVAIVVVVAAAAAFIVLRDDGKGNDIPSSMTDAAGNVIDVPAEVKSITVTSPGAADDVCYMGWGERIVCVSKYCTNPLIPSDATLCGSYSNPDTDAISTANADVTFVDNSGSKAKDAYDSLRSAGMNVVLLYGSDDGSQGVFRNVEMIGYVMGDYGKGKDLSAQLKAEVEGLASKTVSADSPDVLISTGIARLDTDSQGNFTNLDSFDGSGVYLAGDGSALGQMCHEVANLSNPVTGSGWVAGDTDFVSTSLGDIDVWFVLWTNHDSDPTQEAIGKLLETLRANPAWANVGAVQNGNIVFLSGETGSQLGRNTPYTVMDAMPVLSLYINPECFSATQGGEALILEDLPDVVNDRNLQTLVGYTGNSPA